MMNFNPDDINFNPNEISTSTFNPNDIEFNADDIQSGGSLVDKIPGLAPEVQQKSLDINPTDFTDTVKIVGKHILNEISDPLLGVQEAGLHLLGGFAGMGTGALNLANEGVKSLVTGKPLPKGDVAYSEGMDILAYHPKTDTGDYLVRKVIS